MLIAEYERGRYFQEAAALSRRALELKADDPNLYFFAIKAHQDAGDYASALEIAGRAVRKFPARRAPISSTVFIWRSSAGSMRRWPR